MNRVLEIDFEAPCRIVIETISGSRYVMSRPDADGERTVQKNGGKFFQGFLRAIIFVEDLDEAVLRQKMPMQVFFLRDERRALIPGQTLRVGDMLGILTQEEDGSFTGRASTKIKKIEVE